MATRVHKYEMIRFAKSEVGTEVWFKREMATKWRKTRDHRWHKDSIYILHNKYAVLRRKSADTGRPIQVYDYSSLKWETPPQHKLRFNADIKDYRLEPKKDEFEYPIYIRKVYIGGM